MLSRILSSTPRTLKYDCYNSSAYISNYSSDLNENLFHQVMLFVYMVVLFLIFLIQFSVSCACLSVSETDELHIASSVKEMGVAILRSSQLKKIMNKDVRGPKETQQDFNIKIPYKSF